MYYNGDMGYKINKRHNLNQEKVTIPEGKNEEEEEEKEVKEVKKTKRTNKKTKNKTSEEIIKTEENK